MTAKVRIFASAQELLDALIRETRPSNGFHTHSPFLFRGQALSSWNLHPASFRESGTDWINRWVLTRAPDAEKRGLLLKPYVETASRRIAEQKIASDFFVRCERLGLPVPNISQQAHRTVSLYSDFPLRYPKLNKLEWPSRELYPVFAHAQHYGIPTRLLDWTTDPLAAAFFSAESALHESNVNADSRITIWRILAYGVSAGDWFLQRVRTTQNDHKFGCDLVSVPQYGNENLRAQKGLFTINRMDLDASDTLEEIYPKIRPLISADTSPGLQNEPIKTKLFDPFEIIRYELPHSEIRALLKQLRVRNYSPAELFPDRYGVKRAIELEVEIPFDSSDQ